MPFFPKLIAFLSDLKLTVNCLLIVSVMIFIDKGLFVFLIDRHHETIQLALLPFIKYLEINIGILMFGAVVNIDWSSWYQTMY